MDDYNVDEIFSFDGVSIDTGNDNEIVDYDVNNSNNNQMNYVPNPTETFFPLQQQQQQQQILYDFPQQQQILYDFSQQQQIQNLNMQQQQQQLLPPQQQHFDFMPQQQQFQSNSQWQCSGIPPIISENVDLYGNNDNNNDNVVDTTRDSIICVNPYEVQQQQIHSQVGMMTYNGSPDAINDTDSNKSSPDCFYQNTSVQMQQQQPIMMMGVNGNVGNNNNMVGMLSQDINSNNGNMILMMNSSPQQHISPQQQQQIPPQQQYNSSQNNNNVILTMDPSPQQQQQSQYQPQSHLINTPPTSQTAQNNTYFVDNTAQNDDEKDIKTSSTTSPTVTPPQTTPTTSTTSSSSSSMAIFDDNDSNSDINGIITIGGNICDNGRPRKHARVIPSDASCTFSLGKLTYSQMCTLGIDSFEAYVQDQRRERALTTEEESYIKKIRRTIKNRASATKSRNKKNQYVLDLEGYVVYLQRLLRLNNISFKEFVPSSPPPQQQQQQQPLSTGCDESGDPERHSLEPSSASGAQGRGTTKGLPAKMSSLTHSKRKAQFMLAGLLFFALMFFMFNGTVASILGFGSVILGSGNYGRDSTVIGTPGYLQQQQQQKQGLSPVTSALTPSASVHSVVENLRHIFSIENQSLSHFAYQNDYVTSDVTSEKSDSEERKSSRNFYTISNVNVEEEEEEEGNGVAVVEKKEKGDDVISPAFSNENSPVVSRNGIEGGEREAGCNSAFPGIEPRTYEAREWSSKENVPYLFCNDVKHYKPMKKSVDLGDGENELCETQGNRSVGIIIPSSTLGGPTDDGTDDLIEFVCTIDEINFIRRNSSIERKTNLPKIIP